MRRGRKRAGAGNLPRHHPLESLESRRLFAAGDLDPTFSGDGVANVHVAGSDSAEAVVVQSDGKVILAGSTAVSDNDPDFALARLTASGAPDPTFGTGGVVRTNFGFDEVVSSVLMQGNKVLAGGWSGEFFGFDDFDFALARYTSTGQLDPTFGVGGRAVTEFDPEEPARIWSMALQPDGKIVAAGEIFHIVDRRFDVIAVARYSANGQLDPSFGNGGIATFQGDDSQPALGRDVAVLADGRILVLAEGTVWGNFVDHTSIGLLMLNPDGTIDGSFGGAFFGAKIIDVGSFFPSSLEVGSDGSIYVAGTRTGSQPSARVYKFTPEGELVTGFGTGGFVEIASGGYEFGEVSTALQPDAKIVATATTPGTTETWGSWTVARVTPTGQLDPTFGAGGKRTISPGNGSTATVSDVALAPDGKIVAAGGARFAGADYDMVAARFVGVVPPPVERVAGVLLWGSTWGANFKGRVGGSRIGGYTLAAGATAAPLPWSTIDRVSVAFTGDVAVGPSSLTLNGRRVPTYQLSGFQYDRDARLATWSLAAPIPADRVHLAVSPEVAVGGFVAGFGVLPGDANRSGAVNGADVLRVRSLLGTAATPRGTPAGRHDVLADLDGSGRIDVRDVVLARRNQESALPAAQAAGGSLVSPAGEPVQRRRPEGRVSAYVLAGDA